MQTEIQEYSQTEAALSVLREKYTDAIYDVDTTDGMKAAKEARADVRGYRTGLEKMRKEIKAPALERSRLIDTEAKRITGELVLLEEPIDQQIKEFEARKETERQAKIEAEVKRVEDIQERITKIRGAVEAVIHLNYPSAKLTELIDDIDAIDIDDSFDEFLDQAQDAKTATLARLREIHAATVERETEQTRLSAERAELEELRTANEKREAQAQARRKRAEAKAREKREAEEQKQREELEAQRKEQAAAQKKIDDENASLDEKRADLEREQREEADRKAAEEKAEQDRKDAAQAAAKKAKYPGSDEIIRVLAKHFGVPTNTVRGWLTKLSEAA